jgi:hypothetical protein
MISSLKKSNLYREIKKAGIKGNISEKQTFEHVNEVLSSSIPEDSFCLIDYENSQHYRFQLLHNYSSVIRNELLDSSCKYNKLEFESYLIELASRFEGGVVWISSEYPKKIPTIITKIDTFIDNSVLIMNLMEDNLLVMNEDGTKAIRINSEDYLSMDCIVVGKF